jgi:hypothetical protein
VTDDGGEMDLDLGNYERYLLTTLTRDHNITVSHRADYDKMDYEIIWLTS